MAEGQSEYLAHKELAILRGVAFEYPSGGLQLHLTKDVPSSTGAYTDITGTGYEPYSLLTTHWGNAANREIANIAELEFEVPTTAWDTPIGVALTDTDDNVWYFGTNEITKIINAGDPPYFDTGNLIISKALRKQYSSTWWANKRLNVLKGVSIAPPPFVKIVLLSSPPDNSDTIQEINVADYEFPMVPCNTSYWSAPSGRAIANSQVIEFPKPDVDLPEIAGFAIKDDADNVMWKAPLTRRAIYRKDKLFISPGNLIIKA
ncbi:hypothetical protein ACX27_04235 [Nostoc piscinale CENA21]|uniref:Uncharacterized protein n=1 Tax=Nostoc piscinale CENA21 TaxID=224013 RepID=A0A0M4TU86_9NOSO|nr:hypothetical protein [Nostoc piscinale]ALF52239.1 hypothetical protein ACX27_04235 [Nostoc piscinale CENA21]